MAEIATQRPKTYSYLTDVNEENKKAIGTKKCVMKQKQKFEDYKSCLEATFKKINNTDIDSLRENHKEFIKTIN